MTRKLAALIAALVLSLTSGVRPDDGRCPRPSAAHSRAPAAPASPVDQTKVPHYFGPYPNWANSPLTLPDATVVITGAGTGAKAEATVGANGAITGITVLDGGQGYGNAKVDIQSDVGDRRAGRRDHHQEGRRRLDHRERPGHRLHGTDGVVQRQWWRRGDRLRRRRCRQLTTPGDGYSFPTVDFDLPDDPNGVQAQGHAVCGDPHPDCSRGSTRPS